jgi:mono/diheme cytochrome c family protein
MRLLALVGALAIVVGLAVAGYVFGGFFDIAAVHDDPPIVAKMLIRVRNATIARQANTKPPIAVDDPAVIMDGARKYVAAGCGNCHGGPGLGWAKFSEGLNPGPPDLVDAEQTRPAGAVFWIVKNGIRMTGMPSFEKAGLSDEDIWKIAAFVKKLPDVSEANFKSWTAAP